MRPIPPQAIALIREFEGCKLYRYPDSAGLPTIGIGHLIRPGESFNIITQEQAEALLKADMQQAVRSVLRLITRPLTDNQYAALLSFTFNTGGGALQSSTLRMKCNRGEDRAVPAEFLRWQMVRDPKTKLYKRSAGLLRRRKAEAALYSI